MNKDTLINNKITFIEDLITQIKKKKGLKSALLTIAKFFALGFAVTTFFSSPLTALAVAPYGLMFHMIGLSSRDKTENVIENLEKEKKHLESIRTKDLNGSNDLNSKRKKKVIELKKSKSAINKQKKKMGFASILCGITTTIGTLMTLTTPLGGIFTGVGLLGLAKTLDSVIAKNKKENILDTRIDNLQNDLDIIHSTKKSTTIKKQNQTEHSKAKVNNKSKSNVVNKSFIPKQVVYDDSIDKNVEAVNKYIDSLEKQQAKENTKSMVKH